MKLALILFLFIFSLLIAGCQNNKNEQNSNNDRDFSSLLGASYDNNKGRIMNNILLEKTTIRDVVQQKWDDLAKKKIYFGHQSVGYNIVDGIKRVLAENPQMKLNIVETRNPSDFNVGVFAHSRIGKNEDPQSKTEDFSQIINSGVGKKVDIAFHKYCFIDVSGLFDSQQIFENYSKKMQQLTNDYPDVQFIHLTMPLTTIQTGPKAWIKKILGKPIGGLEANIKRHEFNQLLRSNYSGDNYVFDLAAVESQRPDGGMVTFTENGQTYLSMFKGYTTDGGHLNQLGQQKVAENLLIFLANIQK